MLQVFAVVLRDVERDTDLLAELNDLNTELQFARLFIVGGQVLAEVDLVASTLDSEELRNAIDKLQDVDRRIKPMLAAVFGGDIGVDPFEDRWQAYRTTVIEAEIAPGFLSPLNGPEGLLVWPFVGSVFAITGWNPQGIAIDEQANDAINRRIAHDVIDAGGRFLHGMGHNPEGTHTERTLIAWGITRDQALTFGRKASQDAIYEVSPDEVRLLSCSNAREESWPRIPIEPRKTSPC